MYKKLILSFLFLFSLNYICFSETIIPKIDFDDANITDVLQILSNQANLNIAFLKDSIQPKRITLHLKNIFAEKAIDYILRINGLTYEKKDDLILISALPQDLRQTGYKKEAASIELKNISAEKANAITSKLFPNISIANGGQSNLLIINGKESDIKEAFDLITTIDKPVPQILIEGKIIEISKNDSIRAGFDHNNGTFQSFNGQTPYLISTLNALLSDGKATLISSPRIATLDNHEAIINIGNRIPYAVPVSSSSTSTKWSVDFIDAGIKLKITPQKIGSSEIVMTINPEVSSISEWKTTIAGEFPVISTRNASTTLRTKSGESFVIGGLDAETQRENISRIPILGQLPILSLFFQNRTVEKAKTEIVFLITTHII